MALDIGAGDEVITSPYTFFATAGTIARAGARPVFVDIEPDTFNISPAAIEQFIATDCETRDGVLINRATGGRVRALMPVHLYGQVADMTRIMEIARRHRLRVIEDAAQAIGSEDAAGRRACSIGDIGCLSFFPTKNLGAFGDAGACVTNDEELAAKLMKLRVHGMEPKYYHELIGGNFRLDEIQAAVLNVKLPHLDAWSAARAAQCGVLRRGVRARRAWATQAAHAAARAARCATHLQPVLHPRRSAATSCARCLAEHGVGAEIYYPLPLHMQQCFAYLGPQTGRFPGVLRAAQETLALPIYPELSESQLQYVVDTIAGLFRPSRSDRSYPPPMAHDNLTAAWRALQARATETRAVSLRALRDADPARGTRFAREAVGLYLDFSRQRIDDDGLRLLTEPGRCRRSARAHRGHVGAASPSTPPKTARCCTPRCAFPASPRMRPGGEDIARQVLAERERMLTFADEVRDGDDPRLGRCDVHHRGQHRHRRLGPRARHGGRGAASADARRAARALRLQRRRHRSRQRARRRRSGAHAVHRRLEDLHHPGDAGQRAQRARLAGRQAGRSGGARALRGGLHQCRGHGCLRRQS